MCESVGGEATLKEANQRAAAWPSVQPNGDLVGGIGVGRREKPKEQLVGVIGIVTDGQGSSIRLSHIEVDLRKGGPSHSESYEA